MKAAAVHKRIPWAKSRDAVIACDPIRTYTVEERRTSLQWRYVTCKRCQAKREKKK